MESFVGDLEPIPRAFQTSLRTPAEASSLAKTWRVCVSIGFLSKRKSAKSRISTAAGVGRRVCMILYPIAETLGHARMGGFQGEKIT